MLDAVKAWLEKHGAKVKVDGDILWTDFIVDFSWDTLDELDDIMRKYGFEYTWTMNDHDDYYIRWYEKNGECAYLEYLDLGDSFCPSHFTLPQIVLT